MSEEKPRRTRDEARKLMREKGRDLDGDAAKSPTSDDAKIDAMVRKSIKDHGP